MRAVIYRRFGPADEVLETVDLPAPNPGAGEVLVALRASGVNPSDVKLRAGARPGAKMDWEFIVPHSDGAGEIVAVGVGVPTRRIGERVWLWNGQWRRPMGTAAEMIALPADQAVGLPEGTGFAEGACLGIPAMTAWATVLGDGPVAGKTVVVTGGAGSVGRYAIQIARLAGARVITTVSGAAKAAHAGPADHVINYREEDVAERVLELTGGRGADRIVEVDFGSNLDASLRMIAEGGTIAAYASAGKMMPELPFYPLMFRNVRLWMALIYLLDAETRRRGEADLSRWMATGKLTHAVAQTFRLGETSAAHRAVEAGAKLGTVVVEI